MEPEDFVGVLLGDPNFPNELDCAVYYNGEPLLALPDGVFFILTFEVGRPAQATEAYVRFAQNPQPSFSNTASQKVTGVTVDGSVLISP